ncbi:hypothetical protein HFO49_28295 [Rhizobium leguminosarum]|uniref:hypothetical protein n=1 Tax=Rhizobium leguminosarum TaxID=384 RepID=UPI001C96C97B|nr:hypothetical protein [Rhizobium leguminosarum]MBY5591324.1 hypothetical protein [Rhizobium leguminosarum]MBY5604985.1 hypothetical protein [Rhizobium leguminosarum]
MAGFEACEPTLDGARIATHCLYPSFESVHVYVVKDGDAFIVHDGKGAYHAAWAHGRDERAIAKALGSEAAHYHLVVEKNRLELRNVAAGWLRPAILAVANASASAANFVMARAAFAADDDLVAKIGAILSRKISPSRIAKDYIIRGSSGGDRHFDYAVRGHDGYDLLVNGITSHHASYAAKYVAFSDVETDVSNKIAVRDAPLKTDVESLMLKVATIVPLTALAGSKVRAYAEV